MIENGDIITSTWFGDTLLLVHLVLEGGADATQERKMIRVLATDVSSDVVDWYLMPEESITIEEHADRTPDISYRSILETLMNVLHQATGGDIDGTSAYEDAFAILEYMNLVELKEGKYHFLFANLEYFQRTG